MNNIRIPKSWMLLTVFIIVTISVGATHVFTEPPNGITNQTGSYFGNTSNDANNYTADRINVMNSFGVVIGTYLDSYSCDGSYCIYQPWYASGQVYAKNMSTGNIEYSGTDAVTVTQDTVNALTSTGGVIVFNGLLHWSNSSVEVYTDDTSKQIVLNLYNSRINTPAQSSIVFNITGGSVGVEGGTVNGAIYFSPYRQSLLRSYIRDTYTVVDNITALKFEKIDATHWIYESSASGVSVRNVNFANSTTLPGVYISTTDMQFYDMEVAKFGYGIKDISGANTYSQIHVWGNKDGFRLENAVNGITINQCWCEDNSRSGISVGGSKDVLISNSIFKWNGHAQYYSGIGEDIMLIGISKNVSIFNNEFVDEITRYGNSTDAAIGTYDNSSGVVSNNMITGRYSSGGKTGTTTGKITWINNQPTSPYNFGVNATAPTAYGFGDSYQNSTSKDMTCGYDGENWVNSTGNTVVC